MMDDATAPSPTEHSPRSKPVKIYMIVMTVIWLLALLPAGMFALMSPFAFDQGPSPQATRIALGLIGGPFALVGSLLLGWLLFAARWMKAAVVAMLLPILYFVVFLIVSGWAGG